MVVSCHVIKHCFLCCHLITFFPLPIPGIVWNGLTVQSWWHHRGSNSESSPWKGDVFTNSTMVPYNPPKYLYRAGRIFLLVVRHIWIQTCQTFIFFLQQWPKWVLVSTHAFRMKCDMWYFNLKRSPFHVSRGYHFVPPTTNVVRGSIPSLIEAGEYFYLCSTGKLFCFLHAWA